VLLQAAVTLQVRPELWTVEHAANFRAGCCYGSDERIQLAACNRASTNNAFTKKGPIPPRKNVSAALERKLSYVSRESWTVPVEVKLSGALGSPRTLNIELATLLAI
jgi:hypothetical protein